MFPDVWKSSRQKEEHFNFLPLPYNEEVAKIDLTLTLAHRCRNRGDGGPVTTPHFS